MLEFCFWLVMFAWALFAFYTEVESTRSDRSQVLTWGVLWTLAGCRMMWLYWGAIH